MATLVCFHAHPDDESIATGGLMARAAADGHRVVLVVATRGEHGEVAPGFLGDGEQLGVRRISETFAAAEVLGVHRVELLGYVDSGMMGEPENLAPYSFWQADVDAAARRLAAILDEEQAEVLTVYDDHGGYGHPDHIQVHRVGVRAGELAGTPHVYESTMNRDAIAALMAEMPAPEDAEVPGGDEADPTADPDFGSPAAVITHAVDVADLADLKRRAMRAHASQIADDSFFLAMPDEAFVRAFGTEWFIRHGSEHRDGPEQVRLLPGLA
ncbi:PIG-L family deacetylase [Actinomarinicola tropica]|uniref:GlcNAc-PI de-N-acetylase n=1 Tax=Actinomarinicola tropica TaxID=2789776 RepID=A0A5Q2RK88_9ACTN|nr:PIG-L family deacetylase [Actinomarinicola tropica]QGG94816.1 GlcNAc-PI de-N-acetylase [Actinomarinicola tropica]